MNPLIPINSIQLRYISPIYEPLYYEEGDVYDEECIEPGTNVVEEFIQPVHTDGIPRYYRLRYRGNAKDHKKRWNKWIESRLMSATHYFVKVTIIGRRVMFMYNPKLSVQRDKLFKRQEFLKKQHDRIVELKKKIQGQEAASPAAVPSSNTWEENPNEETFEKHFGITLDDYYDDMEEQHVAQEEERWGLLTAEVQERRNDYEER